MNNQPYELPALAFAYGALAPQMSEEQLKIHHTKHHQAYVANTNNQLDKIERARNDNLDYDTKGVLKDLSFQLAGHNLHSMFWENLAPVRGAEPTGALKDKLIEQFGSVDRFKKEFTQGAMSVEGSGWMTLTYCLVTKRLIPMQIEKHNTNIIPNFDIIMVLDMFEHAYYLDYKNDKAKYIEAFWQIVNWEKIGQRLSWLQGL